MDPRLESSFIRRNNNCSQRVFFVNGKNEESSGLGELFTNFLSYCFANASRLKFI